MEELHPRKNYGVIIKLKPTDSIAGAESAVLFEERNSAANWDPYLPAPERQRSSVFDSMACVTFSALNCIETQLNFLLATSRIPKGAIRDLTSLGFIVDDKFNLSDRFTAKVSGTTKSGNSLQAVWDSVRRDGLLPEADWPWNQEDENFDWNAYYSDIPQALKDKAKKILDYFDFAYEWIWSSAGSTIPNTVLQKHLRQAPLQVGSPICPTWSSGQVSACDLRTVSHATEIYRVQGERFDFDSYPPYKKQLSQDYYIPFAMKGVVNPKPISETGPRPTMTFNQDMRYGDMSPEVSKLQQALAYEGMFTLAPTGYYGDRTKQAVKAFLDKYQIASAIVRWLNGGSYTGPMTRQKLNELFGPKVV